MKIHIKIDEIVLYGFNYHDRTGIVSTMEKELIRLIQDRRELNMAQGIDCNTERTIPVLYTEWQNSNNDSDNSTRNNDMNDPKAVGIELARSLYKTLSNNFSGDISPKSPNPYKKSQL